MLKATRGLTADSDIAIDDMELLKRTCHNHTVSNGNVTPYTMTTTLSSDSVGSGRNPTKCPPPIRRIASAATGLAQVELSNLNGGVGKLSLPIGAYRFDVGDSKANCTVEVIVSGNVSVYHMCLR